MKRSITFLILIAILFSIKLSSQEWLNGINTNEAFDIHKVDSLFRYYWKDKKPYKGSGFKQFNRLAWYAYPRLWNTDKEINLAEYYTDAKQFLYDQKNNQDKSLLQTEDWKPLGPKVKPQFSPFFPQSGTGRISCIAFDPSDSKIIYAGSATGGIWKSTSGGTSWIELPMTSIMSIGISDIAISKSNSNIIYIGTGDADAAGFLGINYSFSVGILKSSDAGNTWNVTGLAFGIAEKVLINKVLVHPLNPDLVYAATNKGLYRTTNGGSNWTRLKDVAIRDMKFQPNNPDIIYCAFAYNGKYSIEKYMESNGSFVNQQDIPNAARVALTVNEKNPQTAYALVSNPYPNAGFHSLWKTSNGNNWIKINDGSISPNYLGFWANGEGAKGQGVYDLTIETNPNNPDEVYIGGVNIWKSTNGGTSFNCIAEWTGAFVLPWVHADIHMLKFDGQGNIFACTDGGVNKSSNNGASWIDLSDGLDIAQFYSIAVSEQDANLITGGTQDNGTHLFDGTKWKNVYGSDGMITLIDYSNPNIIYASSYYGTILKSTNKGANFVEIFNSQKAGENGNWVTPYQLHPNNASTIIVGMENVWRSTNSGATWSKISNITGNSLTITSLAISPSNPDYMYISKGNSIYRTSNGGSTWNQIGSFSQMITSILVDKSVPTRFWVTLSGYSTDTKVSYYDGQKWNNMSDGLPNVPVNCIEHQSFTQDRLYVGTDVGIFTRDNSNPIWQPFNQGMPNVIVNTLKVHYASGKLYAGTYGRGVWVTKVVNCNLAPPEVTVSGRTQLCDGDSVKLELKGTYKSFVWSNGSKSRAIWVKSQGKYFVTVTDELNCTANSDVIDVTVAQTPAFEIRVLGKDTFCEGDSTLLNASTFSYRSYLWSNGDTNKRITVTTPGTYWVDCFTEEGCRRRSTNEVTITVLPAPAKPIITEQAGMLISSEAKSYQWYLNKEKLVGETNRSIKPIIPGLYQVEISNENDCRVMSDNYEITTTVEFNHQELATITPNPTDGKISIIISDEVGTNNVLIQLFDLSGKKYLDKAYTSNEIELNLNGYPDGIYILKINYGSISSIYKIIKI